MTTITYDAVDLFAGPGGWDVAAKWLGLRVMGVEFDDAACLTRKAAGLNTVKADVLDVDPLAFKGVRGLIASPPCQTFSTAGKGEGRKALDKVLAAIEEVAAGRDPWDFIDVEDVRTKLVLVPLQWAIALEPEWIAWEQVPTVLPVWEACADVLRSMGYSVVTGNLSAEQYGVPQTRKRAILVARRNPRYDRCDADCTVDCGACKGNGPLRASLPEPTHTHYSKGKARQAGDLLPWVSMADALGWGMTARPYLSVAAGTEAGGQDPAMIGGSGARRTLNGEREDGRWKQQSNYSDAGAPGATAAERGLGERELDDPSFMMTGRPPRWVVAERGHEVSTPLSSDREAFTEEGQQQTYTAEVADYKPWTEDRPATTIATRELVPDPGANANRFNGATKSRNDGVRVTVEQAAVLQSFPPDYPWQGTKTKQFQQVGNAIPPLLAQRVMLAALGLPHAGAVEAWNAARAARSA